MCFIDYNFFPILFFLGWNIFIAKQFTPSIYRYGFVRFDNKDSSIGFRQTTLSKKELFYETQTNLNFGNKLHSQTQKLRFSAKLPVKPIFHISINNSTLTDVFPYLSFLSKTPKIDNANYNSSIYYINQLLTFFTSRPLPPPSKPRFFKQYSGSKKDQKKTFYFSKNRFNKLVEKSDVFLIKNQIQKPQVGGLEGDGLENKRITFLSQTSIQKIYSLSKLQISLCFSSAI